MSQHTRQSSLSTADFDITIKTHVLGVTRAELIQGCIDVMQGLGYAFPSEILEEPELAFEEDN